MNTARSDIVAALEHLARADYLTGHNIMATICRCSTASWLEAEAGLRHRRHSRRRADDPAELDDLDDQATAMGDPALGKLRGRYSLEAWGARLGIPKVGANITDFSMWTPEMQERCVGDTMLCKALWKFLQPDGYSPQALELEHQAAKVCDCITADGVPFDTDAAEKLRQQWTMRRAALEAQLRQQFPGTKSEFADADRRLAGSARLDP